MTKKKTLVFWKDHERLAVAKEFRNLIAEGRKFNSGTLTDANRRVLPVERQRQINTLNEKGLLWLKPMIEALNKEALQVAEPAEPAEPEVKVEAETKAVLADSPIHELSKLILEMMKPYLREVVEQVVAGGIDFVKVSVHESMKEAMQAQVRSYKAEPAKIPKKKIVVVGPYNSEANKLQELFGDKVKLETYNKDKSLETLKKMLTGADEVVVMTDHCTHSATNMVKSVFTGKAHLISGGYSTLKSKLAEITIPV